MPNTEHHCQICGSTFNSRNKLFRHLNADGGCSSENQNGKDDTTKVSILLRISYSLQGENASNVDNTSSSSTSDAYEIGQKVQEAVENGLRHLPGDPKSERDSLSQTLVLGATQTSVARHRPSLVTQESGISSAADFLMLSLQLPSTESELDANTIIEEARKHLEDNLPTSSGAIYSVNILGGMQLSKDFSFHAEKYCTQRIYHYLLPLSWLPDGELLASWCKNYDDESKPPPPSDALAKLRDALQLAESTSIPNRKVRRLQKSGGASNWLDTTTKILNRSAFFTTKERLPWHNFGHVELRGEASPNQEPVWNVLDKARIKGFVILPVEFPKFDHKDEVLIVLEFRGDNFLPGQVQSIVGTAVAVVRGWLPKSIFSMALSKEFLLETPTANTNRLYCAGARFHAQESELAAVMKDRNEGATQYFQVLEYENPTTELQRTQLQVLERVYSTSASNDAKWLEELENSVSPRINKSMLRLQKHQLNSETNSVDHTLASLEACISKQFVAEAATSEHEQALVNAYQRTLRFLRDIISSGAWPETSVARSNVISSNGYMEQSKSNSAKAPVQKGGSFTVFNSQLPNNPLLVDPESSPLGNQKFPELVEAVFDLERVLSESGTLRQRANVDGSLMEQEKGPTNTPLRPPSLCCAVNANASFLPHVDSGRGSGQSLSLIVGLGDYDNGGEIWVEDYSHDIRYRPLEFDGWSSRHWTQPYRGERFSLVFFSPAIST